MEDPNRKVPDLYFTVVDPKLQVADLKAEVEELRSGGIPPIKPLSILFNYYRQYYYYYYCYSYNKKIYNAHKVKH